MLDGIDFFPAAELLTRRLAEWSCIIATWRPDGPATCRPSSPTSNSRPIAPGARTGSATPNRHRSGRPASGVGKRGRPLPGSWLGQGEVHAPCRGTDRPAGRDPVAEGQPGTHGPGRLGVRLALGRRDQGEQGMVHVRADRQPASRSPKGGEVARRRACLASRTGSAATRSACGRVGNPGAPCTVRKSKRWRHRAAGRTGGCRRGRIRVDVWQLGQAALGRPAGLLLQERARHQPRAACVPATSSRHPSSALGPPGSTR